MTTPQTDNSAVATPPPPASQSWSDIAFYFAGKIAAMPDSDRGGLAALRRMNPDEPDAAAFWRLMAEQDLLGKPAIERKWGLILHGLALMTSSAGNSVESRSAHNRTMPVGKALFLGAESQRTTGFYSETRLNRLLTARDDMLRVLLRRMFRMLASARATFDWREMADFILNEGYNEDKAEESRRRIAREYFRAAPRTSAQQSTS